MNTGTVRATAILILAILIIAAGYVYQNHRMAAAQAAVAAQTAAQAATTSNPLFAAVGTGQNSGGGTTHILPIQAGAQAQAIYKTPAYPNPLTFTAKLNDAQKNALQQGYKLALADIAKDKLDFNAWINVGTLNLMAGNTKVAEAVWLYASAQWPSNVVSHNNLGDLYMNYMHDYAKAEKEWLAAIQNKADDPNPYANLFTLYSGTSYKPTNTAAEDILKKGIAANPTAINLQYELAQWYQKLGRTAEAKTEYQVAIDNANRLGQTNLAKQIQAVLNEVK